MVESKIIAARRGAEDAVKDMGEGPLKVKAFEIVFNRLLEESVPSRVPPTSPAAKTSAAVEEEKKKVQPPKSCPDRILFIRNAGFFGQPRSLSEIRDELGSHGWSYVLTSLSGTVQALAQRLELRRNIVREGKKKGYRYVNP